VSAQITGNMFGCSTSGLSSPAVGESFVRAGVLTICLMFGNMSLPATASTYQTNVPSQRTSSGPVRPAIIEPIETSSVALMEIRRRSGLTWEEMADLFEVTRRSVHHWASGKTVAAKHEQIIRQMLTAIRHLDRGGSNNTRDLLLTSDADGVTILELLRNGRFEDARARVIARPALGRPHLPLSEGSRDMRKPPPAALLLDASQDRPSIDTRARIARVARVPKAAG
jgi:DNA-binding transcriptional regulator YiaG